MTQKPADELVKVVEATARKLKSLDEILVRSKPDPDRWSIQEILGHLLDSAANNHHRFVRAQAVTEFDFPGYEQESWVGVQGYQDSSWPDLVQLWRLYNLHLAQVIRRIPAEQLETICRISPYEPVTLGYLVQDYPVHMTHHLQQIEQIAAAASDQH